jgi:hypothetical protein
MKVIVLKRFLNYQPGPADVPDKDVPRLVARKLIEVPGGENIGEGRAGLPVSNASSLVGNPNDVLEPIASAISSSLQIPRDGDEKPLQFLERFADDCRQMTSHLGERLGELEGERDAANREAERLRDENAGLLKERDEALETVGELQAKADAPKVAAPKADPPTDAKKPAAKADAK